MEPELVLLADGGQPANTTLDRLIAFIDAHAQPWILLCTTRISSAWLEGGVAVRGDAAAAHFLVDGDPGAVRERAVDAACTSAPTGSVYSREADGVLPATMPAAVYVGEGSIEVQELPVPELGTRDVCVEVSHCGICGTDLHLVLERYARPGSILGHEWSGTVVAAGSGAGWEIGARVVANPPRGCGECRACRRGRPSVCLHRVPPDLLDFSRGAFCRYKITDTDRLARVPDALGMRGAALAEPTAIAIHTVNLASVTPGDRALVTGGGPVGLLTTAVLRSRGVHDITVSEPAPLRRERALAVGAARAVAPDELPHAPMGRPVDSPYTVAFECSGNARAAESALDQLDYAGTLVFVGTGHEPPRVNHNRVIVMEQTIIGAYNYDADGFGPALDLLASGQLPLDLLIEPVDVGLAEVLSTIRRLAHGELPGKVMVVPR